MTGETDPAPQGSRGHPHNHGFTVFQTGGGHFQFHFGGGGFGHAPQRRDTITSHYFQTTVLSESEKKLFLLNFFSDFCMQCGEVATIWDELREVCLCVCLLCPWHTPWLNLPSCYSTNYF